MVYIGITEKKMETTIKGSGDPEQKHNGFL